jgi:hypothetical protein
VSIYNNIVQDFNGDGLPDWEDTEAITVFGGDAGDPIENVTVANNTVRRINGRDTKGGAVGISVQGNVDGATVRDNVLTEIGQESSSWAFGTTIRGTGNHSKVPRNVDVLDNDISSVLASSGTQYLGVGLGIEADGTSYLARNNTIDDVNIGAELKAAATELTLLGNSISNIDNSVNNANNPSVPPLYLGDKTGAAPIGTFIADNAYDVAVTSGGSFPPAYQQTIVPQ